jgi:hypothetical protein
VITAATILGIVFLADEVTPGKPDDANVDALIEKAAKEYDEGQLDSAVRTLEEARALSSRAAILYNLAQVNRAKGACAPALDAYTRFLEQTAPDDPNRERAQRRQAEMKTCVAEKAASLVPATAVVPAPAKTATYPVASAEPSAKKPENVQLSMAAPQQVPSPVPTEATLIQQPPDFPSPRERRMRIAGWTLAATAVAATGVAGIFQWQAFEAQRSVVSSGMWNQKSAQEGERAANRARWAAGTALLSAGGSATLFILSGRF